MLFVHVKRSVVREEVLSNEEGEPSELGRPFRPLIRKSKLVVVDLAGSERIHKSGSEGHLLEEAKYINLSLSALGKCINALAENSAHVPIRDSKLTRLLRDSFGGSARTSLIVTIGPSPRHRGETSSTILFGQRAMKVENMLKIKEEFDYKSLSRKLEVQLDKLIAENERQQKAFEDELEKIHLEAQNRISEAERNFADALEKESKKCQLDYMETVKKLEEKLVLNQPRIDHDDSVRDKRSGQGGCFSAAEEVEVKKLLENEANLRKAAEEEVSRLRHQLELYRQPNLGDEPDTVKLTKLMEEEALQKKKIEEEVIILRSQLLQLTLEAEQMRRCLDRGGAENGFSAYDAPMSPFRHSQLKETKSGHKPSVATLFEQVGLQKILSLLDSEDANVRIHAVKVLANLAAEGNDHWPLAIIDESNQKRIVEAGGLISLLMLLRSYEDETVRRVAAGAIANLAMNEANQERIMAEGGISLLSLTANAAEDPQTLRMVAGAIANLCGNGTNSGRSLLIEDGGLPWIIQNANNEVAPIRRHIELALCHLAQHEVNAKEMISGGALWELIRISRDCSREDIRNLARRTLTSSPVFRSEMRRLRIEC
ncbi:Kinesin-like protein KIN-UB, partial [Cucurbita argyrosperma subsp. argyrosperma]